MDIEVTVSLSVPEDSETAHQFEMYLAEWNTVVDFPFELLDWVLGLSERQAKIKNVEMKMERGPEEDFGTFARVVATRGNRIVKLDLYLMEDSTFGSRFKKEVKK